MTRERIEGMREVVLPFVRKRLLETNYENLGESDAEEFARDFDEILDLAKSALKQERKIKQEAVIDMVNEISSKAEMGEKEGVVTCPYCKGNVRYQYENGMSMVAKCDTCQFYLRA